MTRARRSGALCALTAVLLVAACGHSAFRNVEPAPPPPTPVSSPTAPVAPVPTASDTDTGPVGIITTDPTCPAWTTAFTDMSKNKFLEGDYPDINQLAAQTPHRVMRRLYEQENAYATAHLESEAAIGGAQYRAAYHASTALNAICTASVYGTGSSGTPISTYSESVVDPPGVFLPVWLDECQDAGVLNDKLASEWTSDDMKRPVAQWTPKQRAKWAELRSLMESTAADLDGVAAVGSNSVFNDFLALEAVYLRGSEKDPSLYAVADSVRLMVTAACEAAAPE